MCAPLLAATGCDGCFSLRCRNSNDIDLVYVYADSAFSDSGDCIRCNCSAATRSCKCVSQAIARILGTFLNSNAGAVCTRLDGRLRVRNCGSNLVCCDVPVRRLGRACPSNRANRITGSRASNRGVIAIGRNGCNVIHGA